MFIGVNPASAIRVWCCAVPQASSTVIAASNPDASRAPEPRPSLGSAGDLPPLAPSPLPAGLRCPACGYELSGSTTPRCSECGRDITFTDLLCFTARQRLLSDRWRLLVRHGVAAAGTVAVMTIGAAVVTRSAAATVGALAVCSIALAMWAGAGWLLSRFAREHERDLYALAWLQSTWWLHGPWLCIPICAAAVIAPALLLRATSWDAGSDWIELIAIIGAATWGVGLFVCLFYAVKRLSETHRRLQLPQCSRWAALMALVWLGAIVLGLVGGGVSVSAAIELAPR